MPTGVDWLVVGPLVAKALADMLAAERARSGRTNDEIFASNDVKIDENEAKLVADALRLQGHE